MIGCGPFTILKSAGIVNSEGSGWPRTIFVSAKICSPMRGSLRLLYTTVCRSGEIQTSVTMLMGLSLPIWPAGIVRVVRVPLACTPSIFFDPRSSVAICAGSFTTSSPIFPAITCGGTGGGTGPSVVAPGASFIFQNITLPDCVVTFGPATGGAPAITGPLSGAPADKATPPPISAEKNCGSLPGGGNGGGCAAVLSQQFRGE